MSTKRKGYSYPSDHNPYETNPCKPQGPHDCTRPPKIYKDFKPHPDTKPQKREIDPSYIVRRREKMRKRTNNNVNQT